MEFTITCPIDGPITVSLEDIDTVVLREAERADITFVCPHCGTEITVTAVVPSFLMAAIEALAEETDSTGGAFSGFDPEYAAGAAPRVRSRRGARTACRVVLRVLPSTALAHRLCRRCPCGDRFDPLRRCGCRS